MKLSCVVQRIWYGKALTSAVAYLLWPFSVIYRCIIFFRQCAFRYGLFKVHRLNVPVIIIGNITTGGAGKSPLTAAVVMHLKQQGYQPGMVSRGYGGQSTQWPQVVTENSDPRLVGDEPVMLVQQTRCPMVVAPNRVQAAQMLLAQHACDIIVSDDGLQHRALGRDLEIAVVDGQRRYGNEFCLPAGPLREPLSRLNSVDAIVSQGHALANEFAMKLDLQLPTGIIDASRYQAWTDFTTPVHAIAGIGDPERFFQALEHQGLTVIRHPFPDHHAYTPKDICFDDNFPVLMTAKDAVKCFDFCSDNDWCVPAIAQCNETFWYWLMQSINHLPHSRG